MSNTAVVSEAGVGSPYVEAYTLPVTCLDVENEPPESPVRENPVTPDAPMGLTPISQLTEESGTLDTPVSDRIAKFSALPKRTGAGPRATEELYECTLVKNERYK